jgi:hypothetical protein
MHQAAMKIETTNSTLPPPRKKKDLFQLFYTFLQPLQEMYRIEGDIAGMHFVRKTGMDWKVLYDLWNVSQHGRRKDL